MYKDTQDSSVTIQGSPVQCRKAFARFHRIRAIWLLVAASLTLLPTPATLTLNQLYQDAKMSPARFAWLFMDFEFKYHDEIQEPEVFLATRSGDCDDYAILAADVLGRKGFQTRLITVRMPGVTHVVCYVAEAKGYLDYNLRANDRRIAKSRPDLPEIAKNVALSFQSSWTSASEFAFTNGVKVLLTNVAKTAGR